MGGAYRWVGHTGGGADRWVGHAGGWGIQVGGAYRGWGIQVGGAYGCGLWGHTGVDWGAYWCGLGGILVGGAIDYIRERGSVLYLGMAKEISKYHTDAPAGKRPKKLLPPKPSMQTE